MTICMVIPLLKIPIVHRVHVEVHHILYMFSGLSLVIRHNNAERIRKQQVVQLTHANFPQALEKG